MTIALESIPSVSATEALAAATREYGIAGGVTPVVSEAGAWDLLDKLELWPAKDSLALIRAACAAPSAAFPEGAASTGIQ